MLEKYGFEAIEAYECFWNHGWGIECMKGTNVYRRADGNAVTWVGFDCECDEPWICEVEVEGLTAQGIGHDPLDALINGYIDHLHKLAVFEEWTKPYLLGMKHCCEDVVNWLGYNVTNAITRGLASLAYDDGTSTDDMELYDHVMGNAIEMARHRASEWGITFEDVWQ